MADGNRLLKTVEAIHAAGLDEALWPDALDSITGLFNAVGTSFEVVDKTTRNLLDFWSHGLPQACEMGYAEHFLSVSPRIAYGLRHDYPDKIEYDYLMLDEDRMRRDAFYSDFLPDFDLRYFVSARLRAPSENLAVVAVQRSPKQGHVEKGEIALMRKLVPHLQQAFDTTSRLRSNDRDSDALRQTIDWLSDGVALVRADGFLAYVNEAFKAIIRRGGGIRARKGSIDFATADARARFDLAIGDIRRLLAGDVRSGGAEFHVSRAAGAAPYLVSVRPLSGAPHNSDGAVAIVFIHDPTQTTVATQLLRETFGLTDAEAAVAQALQSGVSPGQYAKEARLSLNTVYTHLRRIKEKTGCRRMPELIRRLNDLRAPIMGW